MEVTAMIGRQLPFFSLLVPFWLIWAFAGRKGMMEIWPAILVTGVSFAVPQYLVSNFIGPELVDIIAAIVSMVCLVAFLRVWQPKKIWTSPSLRGHDPSAGETKPPQPVTRPSRPALIAAWTPWVILSVFVFIWGLPSAPTADERSFFRPDQLLADGQELRLEGLREGEPVTHTLQAIHTPGHAANHVCLLLVEDALLFSGDHVLSGTTTIVGPPDGNMNDYLQSLDKLDALCALHSVEFILPAHGYVLGGARRNIADLKAHRLRREAKVLAAMQALPQGSPQEWVRIAYSDTPEKLWPIAERSLLAHVERIRLLGLATI